MQEQWLPIKNYEGYFEISNLGRVKGLAKTVSIGLGRKMHLPERIRPTSVASNGYKMIRLVVEKTGKTFTVHRLVALHFVNNPLPYHYNIINHIDGDKLNNRATNLEWTTYSGNIRHAYKSGLKVGAWVGKTGKDHHRTKPIIQIDIKTSETVNEWESAQLAAKSLGILSKGIRSVCSGFDPTYKGYKWAYK